MNVPLPAGPPDPQASRPQRWEDMVARLIPDPEDRIEVEEMVEVLGVPDGAMGDRVATSRVDFFQANREPFRRTPPELMDRFDVPKYQAVTIRTPGGRIYQIQSRLASVDEIEAFLSKGTPQPEPALHVREVRFPGPAPTEDFVDSSTVIWEGDEEPLE